VQLGTYLEKQAQTTPAPAPDMQHNYEWKRHMHMLRSCWLTIGVSLTYHWKNDCNHESRNYWHGPRPCDPLSIEVSAAREHSKNPVIKAFEVSSPEQQWPQRTTQQPFRQLRALLVLSRHLGYSASFAVSSPEQQRPPRTTQQPFRQQRAPLVLTRPPGYSAAPPERTNPNSHDFLRYSPVLPMHR
jgi:hypothetical protein